MGLDLLQNLNIPRRQTVKDKARHSRRSGRALIDRLTAEATGLEFVCGAPESSSFGNFAVQLTTLEGQRSDKLGVNAERVSEWAGLLTSVAHPELPLAQALGPLNRIGFGGRRWA